MVIVSGFLDVAPGEREAYLNGCIDVMRAARSAPGCVAFCLSADMIDPGRISVFEQWATVADAEAFRGSGPSDEQHATIVGGTIEQHEIASTISLFGGD